MKEKNYLCWFVASVRFRRLMLIRFCCVGWVWFRFAWLCVRSNLARIRLCGVATVVVLVWVRVCCAVLNDDRCVVCVGLLDGGFGCVDDDSGIVIAWLICDEGFAWNVLLLLFELGLWICRRLWKMVCGLFGLFCVENWLCCVTGDSLRIRWFW